MLPITGRPRQGSSPACTGQWGPQLLFLLPLPPRGTRCPWCLGAQPFRQSPAPGRPEESPSPQRGAGQGAAQGAASITTWLRRGDPAGPCFVSGRLPPRCPLLHPSATLPQGPGATKTYLQEQPSRLLQWIKLPRDINLHRIMAFKKRLSSSNYFWANSLFNFLLGCRLQKQF